MSTKYRLNLATEPFRPHRATNVLLGLVLVLTLVFTAWQVRGYLGYRAESPDLRALEEARITWAETGGRIQEINARLSRPEAQEQLRELRYLSQVLERKRFSWTRMLQVVEAVIPRDVYLVGLQPEISEGGDVYIQMEARGPSIDELSTFLADLEHTDEFWDHSVSVDERGTVQGRPEIRMVIGVNYAQNVEPGQAAERP